MVIKYLAISIIFASSGCASTEKESQDAVKINTLMQSGETSPPAKNEDSLISEDYSQQSFEKEDTKKNSEASTLRFTKFPSCDELISSFITSYEGNSLITKKTDLGFFVFSTNPKESDFLLVSPANTLNKDAYHLDNRNLEICEKNEQTYQAYKGRGDRRGLK